MVKFRKKFKAFVQLESRSLEMNVVQCEKQERVCDPDAVYEKMSFTQTKENTGLVERP